MTALEGEQRQLERSLDQQVQDLRSTTEDLQSQMQEYQQTKDDVKEVCTASAHSVDIYNTAHASIEVISGSGKVKFSLYLPCFAIFKNVKRSWSYPASHQALNYAQRF